MPPPKVTFITGCSSGLGLTTALRLIQSGHIVHATVRSVEDQKALIQQCNHSKNLFVSLLDLSNDKEIEETACKILSQHPSIDSIIFNAASTLIGPPDSASISEIEYLFKVNVFSTLKIAQIFLPQMRKNKKGHLIFIGSILGIESSGYLGVYSATKFALEALASSWASILYKWNIKTTIIEPGAINTNLPNTTMTGSYYKNSLLEDPYENFNKQASLFLKACLKQGIDPNKVADLIIEILNNPSPALRYQTCPFSKNLVQKHLRDPESKEWLEEHRQFLESFYQPLN